MKLFMKDILDFPYFAEEIKSIKLPLKTTFKISQLGRKIGEYLEFYQTKINEIINTYAEKDEDGNPIATEGGIKITLGSENACNFEVMELQNLEIEVPDVKFNLEEFGNIELSVEVLNVIFPFIEE